MPTQLWMVFLSGRVTECLKSCDGDGIDLLLTSPLLIPFSVGDLASSHMQCFHHDSTCLLCRCQLHHLHVCTMVVGRCRLCFVHLCSSHCVSITWMFLRTHPQDCGCHCQSITPQCSFLLWSEVGFKAHIIRLKNNSSKIDTP